MIDMLDKACIDIYNGDLEKSNRFLNKATPFTVNHLLGFNKQNEIYQMDVLALILKGEAEHPGNFLKYKKMVDTLLAMTGAYRLFKQEKFAFTYCKYSHGKFINLSEKLPVSEQMKIYLKHLHIRSEKQRIKTVSLLKQMDEMKKDESSGTKNNIQQAKRLIVRVYRHLHSKERF